MAGTHVFDPKAQWQSVVDAIQTELPNLLSVEGKSRDLVLRRAYLGNEAPIDDLEGQRKALLTGSSWSVPVYGDLELQDKDGVTLSKAKKLPLFRLPQLTPTHSFIINGGHFQLANQLRLRSGVYTRVKNNGEIESFINLARGGRYAMTLDPEDGRIRMRVGTASPALFPLLKILGVSDKKIEGALGDDLFEKNRHSRPASEIPKLYRALFRSNPTDFEEAEGRIRQRFLESEISPETTKMTLGKSYTRADGDLLLAAAKSLIEVQRGVRRPDRRDSPAFKELLASDDIFRERLSGPTRREMQYRIRRKLDPRPGQKVRMKIREILEIPRLQKMIDGQFNSSQLARHPDQINPLETTQNAAQITMTGEGGIRDRQMITIPMRNVDPGMMGFIDPLHTPEGASVGVVQHLAIGAGKKGREMTSLLFNVRSNKFEERTPAELHDMVVALPGSFDVSKGKARPTEEAIPAYQGGEFVYVEPNEVDYVLPAGKQVLDYASNLIPYVNSASGARVLMAARHQQQAVSLKEREPPLVSPALNGVPFTKLLAPLSGATFAPAAGTVEKVTDREIVLKTKKGEVKIPLYRDFPLNSKSYLHSEPKVTPGDRVEERQLLADSTFTRDGELALGKNLLVAYVPYKHALTFEDAIVISESASRRLTSLHQYREDISKGEGWEVSKRKFVGYFPARFKQSQLDLIGGNGLPEIGTVLYKGDPVALVLRKQEISEADKMLGRLSRGLVKPYKDKAITWEEEVPGKVVDVITEGTEVTVLIQTEEPAEVGDKLSGRHGNKGIISRIVPDSEMLRTKDGEVIDVVMNPLGITTRMNDSQMIEALAGRAAEKLGKPVIIDNFSYENNEAMARELAQRAGVAGAETLTDPSENLKLDNILVGRSYIHKLDHPVRKKYSARSIGTYTADLVPAKRSGESAQSIDPMTLYSILAHGAKANVREMGSIKSEDRMEAWRAFIMGEALPTPKPTFAFGHFRGLLQAAGARVERDGKILRLMPMTDEEILATSRGPIHEPKLFVAKTMRPERGGLFDPVITGGSAGENWAHVPLAEPIPNPIFEKAILSVTGLRESEYRDILEGRACVVGGGGIRSEDPSESCIAGGKGIQRLLRSVDLRAELTKAKDEVPKARAEKLNILNRKIRFLSNFIERGIDPGKFVLSHLPIIPPRFRPLYNREDGTLVVSDLNNLYKDVVWVNKQLGEANAMEGLPDSQKNDLRRDLYDSAKALMGFGAPLSDPNLRGIFTTIRGAGSPKSGHFQHAVLRRRQDLTGRSTITPDGGLGVDEVGIPSEMLWTIFKPMILRQLVQQGSSRVEAEQIWKDRDPRGQIALDREVEKRPVLLNRAPSLHRHSILAMKPVSIPGRTIRLNPLVVKGFNADFDGDQQIGCVLVHVSSTLIGDGSFWSMRTVEVAQRFREQVGVHERGGSFAICDLQDFPHSDLIGSKNGIDYYAVPKGLRVVAFDDESFKLVLAEVSGWSVRRRCPVHVITLGSGREIVSDDDERAIYGVDSRTLEWCRKRPSEAGGLLVPIASEIGLSSRRKSVPLPRDIKGRLREKAELSAPLGYFLGLIVGDGWASISGGVPKGIHLASSYGDVTAAWEDSLLSVFHEKPTITRSWLDQGKLGRSKGSWRHTVSSSPAARWIVDMIGHGSSAKHLPPFFVSAPREFLLHLLGGLWDSDGSVSFSHGKQKPQFQCNLTTTSIRLAREVQYAFRLLGVSAGLCGTQTPSGKPAWVLSVSTVDLYDLGGLPLHHSSKKKLLHDFLNGPTPDRTQSYSRFRLVPMPPGLASAIRDELGVGSGRSMYVTLSKAIERCYVSKEMAKSVLREIPSMFEHPLLDQWRRLVGGKGFHFERIVRVAATDMIEEGYDLTVPGFETFMAIDGVVLSNTMAVHVPITAPAIEEAWGLLPSKQAFSASGDMMLTPRYEALLGLNMITREGKNRGKTFDNDVEAMRAADDGLVDFDEVVKIQGRTTTPGRVIVNQVLPKKLRRDDREITSKGLQTMLSEIAHNNPKTLPSVLDALKTIGFQSVYRLGFSVPFKSLREAKPMKDRMVAKAQARLKNVPLDQLAEEISKVYGDLIPKFNQALKDKLPRNPFVQMAASGARGNIDQVRQVIGAPLLVEDAESKLIPYPMTRSFAEGLTPQQFWMASFGGRKGTVDVARRQSEPGALGKSLIATAITSKISMMDCGTKRGRTFPLRHDDVLGRALADPTGRFLRNEIIDDAVFGALEKDGFEEVRVRTPTTCDAPHGVCALCFGHDERQRVPALGTPIGIISSQALSEPASQSMLGAKHRAGIAGKEEEVADSIGRIRNLLQFPKVFKNKGAIARELGAVTGVEANPAGGHLVTINGARHLIPPGRKPIVRVGQEVRPGDLLSTGFADPRDVLQVQGPVAAREFIADSLLDVYKGTGQRIPRRHFETVARAVTDTTRVLDPAGYPGILEGDIHALDPILVANADRKKVKELPVRAALGAALAEDIREVGGLGKILSAADIDVLEKRLRRRTVQANPDPIIHQPILKGIDMTPDTRRDWLSHLSHRRLRKVLEEGVPQGWESDISEGSLLPAYIAGNV